MKKSILFSLATVAGAGAMLALADVNPAKSLAPKLTIDKSAPIRTGAYGGYSDIVSKVSPSVVSIFTSREMASGKMLSRDELPDLFNSPMFREFFGERGIPRPEAPRRSPGRRGPAQQGLGSGVILSEDGYILTNNHVVDEASDIQVRLDNGKEYEAEMVASDPASDLAVIKVEAKGLPAATLGDSEGLLPGDTVLAIGSPFGLNHTVTSGIVSATGRDNLNIVGYENFIQTDASINPGNSGGALIDNRGRVIGINTAIFSRSGGNVGIGFAIPVNMAVNIAEELISNGEIERGYLGVALAPLDEKLKEALDVKGKGVLVNDVVTDTPADKAGFKPGDVIMSVGGQGVEDMADVRRMVGAAKPGSELQFQVNRSRKPVTLTATIGKIPTDSFASHTRGRKPSGSSEVIENGVLKGVKLGELDRKTRENLGLGNGETGVVVLDIDPDSKAAHAGLSAGDVIMEINRSAVSNPQEAIAKASDREGRATLLRITDGKRNRFLAIG